MSFTNIRWMYGMQTFKSLLECWAEFIKQSSLAGKYCIATTRWCLNHSKKCVWRRVHFIWMISVVFLAKVSMSPNISSERCQSAQILKRSRKSYPPRPIMVTCFGSCWFGSLSCYKHVSILIVKYLKLIHLQYHNMLQARVVRRVWCLDL